jgi:hypothetical protein
MELIIFLAESWRLGTERECRQGDLSGQLQPCERELLDWDQALYHLSFYLRL